MSWPTCGVATIGLLGLNLGATMIWWWNPLFWIVRRQLRESSEMACDAIALSVCDRGAYAKLFLELSSTTPAAMPVPALGVSIGTHSSFERRLAMILSEKVSGRLSLPGILIAACFAVCALPTPTFGQSSAQSLDDPPRDQVVTDKRSSNNATDQEESSESKEVRKAQSAIDLLVEQKLKAKGQRPSIELNGFMKWVHTDLDSDDELTKFQKWIVSGTEEPDFVAAFTEPDKPKDSPATRSLRQLYRRWVIKKFNMPRRASR